MDQTSYGACQRQGKSQLSLSLVGALEPSCPTSCMLRINSIIIILVKLGKGGDMQTFWLEETKAESINKYPCSNIDS
jgi:hypothetical protein